MISPGSDLRTAMPATKPAQQTPTVWNNSMKQRLTPNYDHKKLADPSCADLMDVFEDAWKGYILDRRARGERRPETFDFLGFTHYCAKSRSGSFVLGRKPVGKRVERTLGRVKAELRRRMHRNPYEVAKWLGKVMDGWLRYYAVPTSFPSLTRFEFRLRILWLRAMRRRSQMDRTRLEKLGKYAAASWPPLKILHPWPEQRFRRQRPEVGAPCVNAHAGICAGGAG
ncbi:MAG: hypothetical protein OXF27_08580 [Acidobacteria bacterium]|nr:hypothetical protein [Acidobacteriota bacterium]